MTEKQRNLYELLDIKPPLVIIFGNAGYNWMKNFHLAFREIEGATFEYESNGIHIILENAERIEFSEEDFAPDDPHRSKKVYRTCRNWQFAHKIAPALVRS